MLGTKKAVGIFSPVALENSAWEYIFSTALWAVSIPPLLQDTACLPLGSYVFLFSEVLVRFPITVTHLPAAFGMGNNMGLENHSPHSLPQCVNQDGPIRVFP